MEMMARTSKEAVAATTNAPAACLLGQRALRGSLEVCLACAGRMTNLRAPDDGHIDPKIIGGISLGRPHQRLVVVRDPCSHHLEATKARQIPARGPPEDDQGPAPATGPSGEKRCRPAGQSGSGGNRSIRSIDWPANCKI